jgi:hypothetical protein
MECLAYLKKLMLPEQVVPLKRPLIPEVLGLPLPGELLPTRTDSPY